MKQERLKYKGRRGIRYKTMIDAGLLPEEAEYFSSIAYKDAPYMKNLIADRKKEFDKAKRKNITTGEFQRRLRLRYRANGWKREYLYVDDRGREKRDGPHHLKKRIKATGRKWLNPYDLLETYKNRYKMWFPGYSSPSDRRTNRVKDHIAATEETKKRRIPDSMGKRALGYNQ